MSSSSSGERFPTPSRPPPSTPTSNFVISMPDSDSDDAEENEVMVTEDDNDRSDETSHRDRVSPTASSVFDDVDFEVDFDDEGLDGDGDGDDGSTRTGSDCQISLMGDDEEEVEELPEFVRTRRARRLPARVEHDDESEDFRSLFGSKSSAVSEAMRRRRLRHEGVDNDPDDNLNDAVMTVVWTGGKVGIAYYLLETSEMYVLPDTAEALPDIYVFRSLFRQILPRFIVMSSSMDDRYLRTASEICGQSLRCEDGDEAAQERVSTAQLITVQSKLFSPEDCKQRVLAMKLPFEPKEKNEMEHELFIGSLIPMRNDRMVRACGALLQYLDKRARELFQLELVAGRVPVLNIKPCTMDDIVMIDDTAWHSLHIFSVDMHPSLAKQARNAGSKEGISVFGMLSEFCSTTLGSRAVRLMLLRPSRRPEILERRYEVIDYCLAPRNIEFTKSASSCLKGIKSFPKLLYRLTTLHASMPEWKDLYTTLCQCLLLGEICSGQSRSISLFRDLSDPGNLDVLRDLSAELRRKVNFEESLQAGRIITRDGVDREIDIKKKQYACLTDLMATVAEEELKDLPGYVQRCNIVYIPEVGYLLQVWAWRDDLTREEMEIADFELQFCTNETLSYKTPRCKELDTTLGDCSVAILQLETGVMIYLAETILERSATLVHIGNLAAELDGLMSMASVAKSRNFVRPQIVSGDEKLEIWNGRHPLMEQICEVVPNSTKFENEEKVVIITGPNASGKSIYLKQVGVITIMALSGSFVPANSAIIPTVDRICTRIHATESVSSGFSSFMMDLTQMSLALRTTSKQSLIIIDEFGKGTTEVDGLALAVASVQDFLDRASEGPTVFLSTHFFSMITYLKPSSGLKSQSMKYLKKDQTITYLYELTDTMCNSSLACLVAESAGINPSVITRSRDVEKVINKELRPSWLFSTATQEQVNTQVILTEIGQMFEALEISTHPDTSHILTQIKDLCVNHQ